MLTTTAVNHAAARARPARMRYTARDKGMPCLSRPSHTANVQRQSPAKAASAPLVERAIMSRDKRDARFGPNGYVRCQTNPRYRTQLAVTAPLPAAGAERAAVMVNIDDIGFSMLLCDRQGGHAEMVPANYNPAGDHYYGVSGDDNIQFPQFIHGWIERLANVSDGSPRCGVEFVRLSFRHGSGLMVIENIRWLPFSSYQDHDGALVGVVRLGLQCYRFRIEPERGLLSKHNCGVVLQRADKRDMQKLRQYQILQIFFNGHQPQVPGRITRLRDAPALLVRRFACILDRAEILLQHATETVNGAPDIAQQICARFATAGQAPQGPTTMLWQIYRNMQTMKAGFCQLRRQARHVVGFFDGIDGDDHGGGAGVVTGTALPNSMVYAMDYRHMPGALIGLNAAYFGSPEVLNDDLAALLLHEYSHACIGTIDAAGEQRKLYARSRDAAYELQPLMEAAMRSDRSTASHAPTLEHIIVLLAYSSEPVNRHSLRQFLAGGSTYRRSFIESDFDDIAHPFQG